MEQFTQNLQNLYFLIKTSMITLLIGANITQSKQVQEKSVTYTNKQNCLQTKFSFTAKSKVPYLRHDSLAESHSNLISNFK